MTKPPNARILVVDDEPQNIRLLQIRLQTDGHTVLAANNGQEALELVHKNAPDLILLDIMMPGMNGFEVCQQIRAEEATQFIPVVMVTALSEQEDRIKAIEAGADDFISKPFDSYEVLARVRSLVRIKRYHDALEQANRELKLHNERLDKELQMASEIQDSLMPQGVTDLLGFRIVSHYTPAVVVGGDFFDLWEVERGRLGVFISDVMGHGVSAAFITVFIKTIVEEMSVQTDDPGHLLKELNTRFNKMISSQQYMFATAFCGVIDLDKETLHYANAGHPFPFLVQRQHNVCRPIGDQSTGKGLGLLPDSTYQTHHYPFTPSDGLFLYTDGAYELQNSRGEEFTPQGIQEVITQQIAQPAPVLVETVLNKTDQFSDGRPKDDDITIVAIDGCERRSNAENGSRAFNP